jgi:NADPH:quinone reductase-like Zn-dependent oxidoreductase
MKAVVFHETGGPEVLKYEDAPDPHITRRGVFIHVRACALNRVDIWVRSGAYETHLPHILGSEFAGDVVQVGDDVEGLQSGDRVLVYPGLFDGTCRYCLAGEENECDNFGIIGSAVDGGYAEYVNVPAANVFKIPDGIGYNEAAAVPLVFVTAWHMLITRAGLKAGERVLIQAAGSGIGSAAVQIAKLAGAEVFATAGSDAKLAKAEELGADHLINYNEKNFTDEVKRLTKDEGVHVVFEHTGAKTFPGSIMSLKKNGRLVIAGATTGSEGALDLRYLYNNQLSVIGSMLGTRSELMKSLPLVQEGKLKPVIDRVMPLSEARTAHEILADRKQFGKIILSP